MEKLLTTLTADARFGGAYVLLNSTEDELCGLVLERESLTAAVTPVVSEPAPDGQLYSETAP